jgi:hypothetical protein
MWKSMRNLAILTDASLSLLCALLLVIFLDYGDPMLYREQSAALSENDLYLY